MHNYVGILSLKGAHKRDTKNSYTNRITFEWGNKIKHFIGFLNENSIYSFFSRLWLISRVSTVFMHFFGNCAQTYCCGVIY